MDLKNPAPFPWSQWTFSFLVAIGHHETVSLRSPERRLRAHKQGGADTRRRQTSARRQD
jgi:hypothetical protein